MANTPQTRTPAQAAPSENALETELERAERNLHDARDHPLFGVHPDGIGPTLGQDLHGPKPAGDADGEHEAHDPPR